MVWNLQGWRKKTHLVVVACNGLSQVMLALDSKGFSALDLTKVLLPAVCSTCSIYISSSVFFKYSSLQYATLKCVTPKNCILHPDGRGEHGFTFEV